jgi:general secretion pathway protein I
MPPPMPTQRAFTLLEVMVAVTILGIALTAIFSSEAAAIRVAGRARMLTTATLLARCKMGEIEEQILREGLPAVSANGTDECCDEGEVEGYECEWEIMRIVLPDAVPMGGGGSADGSGSGSGSGGGGAAGAIAGLLGGGGGSSGAMPGMTGGAPPTPDQLMSGAMMSGGGDMVGQLALQFVFPILKPQLEEQVRRARVTVRWHQGESEQEFQVSQYLVAEQPPVAATEAALGMANPLTGAPPPTTSGGGAPPPSGTTPLIPGLPPGLFGGGR